MGAVHDYRKHNFYPDRHIVQFPDEQDTFNVWFSFSWRHIIFGWKFQTEFPSVFVQMLNPELVWLEAFWPFWHSVLRGRGTTLSSRRPGEAPLAWWKWRSANLFLYQNTIIRSHCHITLMYYLFRSVENHECLDETFNTLWQKWRVPFIFPLKSN